MRRQRLTVFFCGATGSVAYASWQRAEVLRELGFDVSMFDCTSTIEAGFSTRVRKFLARSRFVYPKRSIAQFNQEFINRIETLHPQILWTEKVLLLLPETLERVRQIVPDATLVCCQEDNPFGQRSDEMSLWRNFVACIPHYDLHFTKRNRDIEQYKRHGARRVAIIRQAFYPALHHPQDLLRLPADRRHDVVFIGTPHDHRVAAIRYLLETAHLPLHVYGNRWDRHLVYYRNRSRFHGAVIGRAYAEVLSGSKIALGYVSWSNHDEYTVRSLEIPACRAFFIAERTPIHQSLYLEGVEAEFFGSDEECADKVRFYLDHDDARRRIAQAGHERCLRSDYSLQRCMREAMEQVADVRGAGTFVGQ